MYPYPFIRWAGGKTQSLETLASLIPREFNRYYEPFLGGGSFMFRLCPATVRAGDLNGQLVNCYRQIRFAPASVLGHLREFRLHTPTGKYYMKQRHRYNALITEGEMSPLTAALMLWLNRQCFNGVYRVNRAGEFNVSYNKKNKPARIDAENIMCVSDYLNRGDIQI